MIRIAIAEDEAAAAETLKTYLGRYTQEKQVEFNISVFRNGMELVEEYNADYDILLMDIEMPLMDGMRAAHKIREMDPSVVIIFITNMAKYAIKGYEVGAMDFVLKPVSYFAFSMKITKAVQMLKAKEQIHVLVPFESGIRRIASDEIFYIEVADHWLQIHTAGGTYRMLGSLKEMEKQLEKSFFARCNKCYLVNLRHVVQVKAASVLLSSGEELLVSRPRRKEFQMAIMNYYGGGAR